MKYSVKGNIDNLKKASFQVKENNISFGVKKEEEQLPNPVELLLGSFCACCLKNVERFSQILNFEYEYASIEVIGNRQENPTKLKAIDYVIYIKSEHVNLELLHKNIQKFGTIYNTLKEMCKISGELKLMD
jgi:uncharacterized OsmC-like protein